MRVRLFFASLGLTLLLILPMIGAVQYLSAQRQMQEEVRRANAADSGVQVESGSRYTDTLLLAVQREEPGFVLLRLDAPAARLTLCGLPAAMQVAAPSGTTTLGEAYLAAGPARVVQLLADTADAAPQHYLAATPAALAALWDTGTALRLDTSALLDTEARAAKGLTDDPVVDIELATAETALRALADGQSGGTAARLRAAVWGAALRQNPEQLGALPTRAREMSARLLTDLRAQDWNSWEQAMDYLGRSAALTVETVSPALTARPNGELALTETGITALRALLE